MLENYIYEQSGAPYADRILLIDDDDLESRWGFMKIYLKNGFKVISYEGDLHFRVNHEETFKAGGDRIVILAKPEDYVPYDIRNRCREYHVSIAGLFPKLNAGVIREWIGLDSELLFTAYQENFDDLRSVQKTENFIRNKVYERENVKEYVLRLADLLRILCNEARSYKDWIYIAEQKAKLDVFSTEYRLNVGIEEVQSLFLNFILGYFGNLSAEISDETPVLVSRAMDYMHEHSDKFVIIVMDGMSEFDWTVISRTFTDINYERAGVFAMIPTITSISRQCLLSNKFPRQLENMWSQSKEKKEFRNCARNMGFRESQISYSRGYYTEFTSAVKCGAVIINEVDDMVHGQKQGRGGMLDDIKRLAEEGKLHDMVRRFLRQGFDVYITADHGNVPCIGQGLLHGVGVETETKSHRMIALKEFADKGKFIEEHNMIEFPKYYLDKQYDYLICNTGESFDAKGEKVMTHGGITLDEVIVPFIKIKAVDNHA